MRDYLYGAAQVRPLALLGYHRVVDLAGGDIVGLGSVHAEEALVVSEVEVGLGTVLRDIALAVLVRIQRTGVDVDIGVELLDCDSQAACLEQFGKRCCDYALAE